MIRSHVAGGATLDDLLRHKVARDALRRLGPDASPVQKNKWRAILGLKPLPICDHDPSLECGCWVDDDGQVRRHAFRFLPGDRVCWSVWKGLTGTVEKGGERIYVRWDPGIITKPTAFPASFEIRHLEEP